MGRHRVFLLGSTLTLLVGGCGEWQQLPVELYIDSHFSETERAGILAAVDEWNYRAGGLYRHGDSVFKVVGETDDTFNEHDTEDGAHVIYRIGEPTSDEQYVQQQNGGWVVGNSTLGDCFLILYSFERFFEETYDIAPIDVEAGEIPYVEKSRYVFIRNVALHELGHMLGLTHYAYERGVMDQRGTPFIGHEVYLEDADLVAFCEIYDC